MSEVKTRITLFFGALLFLGINPAGAHHSFAMFDRKVVAEITGTLKKLQWTNPHVYIEVETHDGAQATTWTMEGGAPVLFEMRGFKKDTIKVGEKLVIRFHPLRNGAPGGELMRITGPDGKAYAIDQFPPKEGEAK